MGHEWSDQVAALHVSGLLSAGDVAEIELLVSGAPSAGIGADGVRFFAVSQMNEDWLRIVRARRAIGPGAGVLPNEVVWLLHRRACETKSSEDGYDGFMRQAAQVIGQCATTPDGGNGT